MVSPKSGDVLIRDVVLGCAVVDAISLRELAGPFDSLTDAASAARRLARSGHVWRENQDRRGRVISAPFPIELPASTLT